MVFVLVDVAPEDEELEVTLLDVPLEVEEELEDVLVDEPLYVPLVALELEFVEDVLLYVRPVV